MPKITNPIPFFSNWVLMAMVIHLFTGTAHADIKEGAAALAAGNGTMAVRELKPLAEEGNALAQGLLRVFIGWAVVVFRKITAWLPITLKGPCLG